MKIHKSQSGFSPVHVVLILVLVGIIGFTGWKVYDAGKPTKMVDSNAVTPDAKKESNRAEENKIPDGFTEYENKDLGFKFIYPQSWGEVQVNKTETESLASGSSYRLSFLLKKEINASFRSKDWKMKEGVGGRGGAYWDAPLTFSTATENAKDVVWNEDPVPYAAKVLKKDNHLVLLERCADFTSAVTMEAYIKLNSAYDVGYFYYLLRGPKADGSGVDLTGCDNLDKLFEPIKKEFTDFVSTIKPL